MSVVIKSYIDEVERLNKEVAFLKSQPQLAQKAIDMFCDPSLRESAQKWLNKQRSGDSQ